MTYEELIARDRNITQARDLIIERRVGTCDFARRTLTHAFDYLYSQSNATYAALKDYFSQEVSA